MFRRKPPRIHDLEMSFIKCVVLLLVVGFFDHAGRSNLRLLLFAVFDL